MGRPSKRIWSVFWDVGPGPRGPRPSWPINSIRSLGICVVIHDLFAFSFIVLFAVSFIVPLGASFIIVFLVSLSLFFLLSYSVFFTLLNPESQFPCHLGPGPTAKGQGPVGHSIPAAHLGFALSFIAFLRYHASLFLLSQSLFFLLSHSLFVFSVSFIVIFAVSQSLLFLLSHSLFFVAVSFIVLYPAQPRKSTSLWLGALLRRPY